MPAKSDDGGGATPHISVRYVAWVERHKRALACAWLIYIIVSSIFAPRLMTSTSAIIRPPRGSIADASNARLAAAFHGVGAQSDAVVYAVTSGETILTPAFEAFTDALNASAHAFRAGLIADFGSYYTLAAMDLLPEVAAQFVSRDNRTGIIAITMNCAPTDAVCYDFVDFLTAQVNQELAKLGNPDISVTITGLTALASMILATVESDMLRMDAIVLPIAAAMLLCLLRSFRLMLLPAVAIAFSVAGSFAGAYLLTFAGEVFSSVPSLMMSVNVALCVDYSLFLNIRYRAEMREHGNHRVAVAKTLRYAGHNIIVSSVTLIFCFAGMMFYPIVVMRTLGLSAAISVCVTVLVNLGLTPLLYVLFEGFFVKGAHADVFSRCQRRSSSIAGARELQDPILGGDAVSSSVSAPAAHEGMVRSFWYRLGSALVRPRCAVFALALVAAAVAPVAMYCVNDKLIDDLTLNLPRGAAPSAAYIAMTNTFGFGSVYPYKILMSLNASVPVASPAFFDTACAGVKALIAGVPDVRASDFKSIFFVEGQCVNYAMLPLCRLPVFYAAETAACNTLFYGWNTLVSPDGASALVELTLGWDPVGIRGPPWLHAMRGAIADLSASSGLTISMTGHAADGIDTWNDVVDAFPAIVGATAAVVLAFTGYAFKSVLIPLRSVATIALTVCFVWGLADMTYEHEFFNSLGFGGLQGTGAIQWLAYICDFSIVVGLALDYDCYVTVAIIEAHDAGHSSKEAIVRGLYQTGYVITAAGAIMALAFFGLLLSSISGINMVGFYLVVAVLFDTFLVRAVVVPAIMGLFGDWNWWPGVRKPKVPLEAGPSYEAYL